MTGTIIVISKNAAAIAARAVFTAVLCFAGGAGTESGDAVGVTEGAGK